MLKNIYVCFLLVLLFYSCIDKLQNELHKSEMMLSKLDQLNLLPKDTVLEYCDLSDDSLIVVPDLSGYTIKTLNLSHNLIDTLIVDSLPKGLVKLDLSYNLLKNIFSFRPDKEYDYSLYEIIVSHNDLTGIDIGAPLYRIIASDNDIEYINLYQKNIQYLDISNNLNLNNIVGFDPKMIDTVICNNIANDRPLVFIRDIPFVID